MTVVAARNAVGAVFVLNGLLFSCLVARLPDVRSGLDLTNGPLGLLLLTISVGSLATLTMSGRLVARFGASSVVRAGCLLAFLGAAVTAVGVDAAASVPVTAVGFVLFGAGNGCWDVAMNVEAAEVERELGRTIMPRFHAGWSLGAFAGAGAGVVLTRWEVPMAAHLLGGAVLACGVAIWAAGRFVAVPPEDGSAGETDPASGEGVRRSAWTEPRTLAIGLMVLCFTVAEGAANDWLTLALIDGYGARHWVGVAGFAAFVCAMTIGRLVGPVVLDRFGRVPVLAGSAIAAAAGVVLVVYGAAPPVVALGILLWGLGTALGFPVGMSAAADDPVGAARRVGVVATVGYGAFLTGPPLLGALGDAVGTLESLVAVAVLLVVAVGTTRAAGRRSDVGSSSTRG